MSFDDTARGPDEPGSAKQQGEPKGTPAGSDDELRIRCPACREPQRADDHFCTHCGAVLIRETEPGTRPRRVVDAGAHPLPTVAASSPPPVRVAHSVDTESHGLFALAARVVSRPRLLLGLLGGMLVAALVVGVLWRVEVSNHSDTRETLRSAQVEIGELQVVRDRLNTTLKAEQALSERRAELLRRTKAVLTSVDPLLASVDEMQLLTGKIQTARNTFVDSTSTLVDDLVTLGNYLIDTGAYASTSYVNSMADIINSELDTIRNEASALSSYDSRYGESSRRFERRATALANTVKALNKQLVKLSK